MNDGNLEELCKLAYLPSWANLKTYQNQYLTAASEWIRNEEYITSLDVSRFKTRALQVSMSVMCLPHAMQFSSVCPK